MREISVSSFRDFCSSFQAKERIGFGVTREIYLLERVLQVGDAMVTSELR